MTRRPLMPKATAVWLVDNTALSFDQVAEFCGLHPLEVKGIADGDVAQGIKGLDPIAGGQLTREEIKRAEKDQRQRLKILELKIDVPAARAKRGPRYTPLSRRQDRPNAVLWLLKSHPELRESQIMRLVGTTKPTIEAIRDRTHWNSANLQPLDPVTMGLCSQVDLDNEVQKAAERLEKERRELAGGPGAAMAPAGTLLPTEQTMTPAAAPAATIVEVPVVDVPKETEAEEAARVFEKLKSMTQDEEAEAADDDDRRP